MRLVALAAFCVASIGVPLVAQDLTETDFFELREAAGPDAAGSGEAFLKIARKAAASGNWGAALKGYAEAALIYPNAEALSGSASAFAMITRDRDGCANGYAIKISDLGQAYSLLAIATRLADADADGESFDPTEALTRIQEAAAGLRTAVDACR